MQIIKEDEGELIFEDHPNANPDKGTLLFIIILALVALLAGLFFRSLRLSDVVFAAAGWLFIIGCFFVYNRLYAIKVKVDKNADLISIFNLTPSWTNFLFFWDENPIEIPIPLIKKIEYMPWTPLQPYLFILSSGRLVFLLDENSNVTLHTWGVFASYKTTAKWAKK